MIAPSPLIAWDLPDLPLGTILRARPLELSPATTVRRRRHRTRQRGLECTVPRCPSIWTYLVYRREGGGVMAKICQRHADQLRRPVAVVPS